LQFLNCGVMQIGWLSVFLQTNSLRMKFEKIHNKGQAKLFRNQYLEMLTKTHPLVIWGIYLPIIVYFLYYSNAHLEFSIIRISLTFISGIFFWTFFEYIMHRFIFHFIAESERSRKIIYVMHGNHHEYPRDRERLFTFMFFPGFMLGYLLYGSMHYAIHAWNPPFRWLKPLWRNHHLHHYKNDHQGFGVSTTIWDRVFGTMFNLKKEKEDKEKVQELMFK